MGGTGEVAAAFRLNQTIYSSPSQSKFPHRKTQNDRKGSNWPKPYLQSMFTTHHKILLSNELRFSHDQYSVRNRLSVIWCIMEAGEITKDFLPIQQSRNLPLQKLIVHLLFLLLIIGTAFLRGYYSYMAFHHHPWNGLDWPPNSSSQSLFPSFLLS